ncbi:MAG TPA: Rieske (2Fe-2S) protein [Gammaproteobacteria bacterium]|nr:Rieske (2Fe-2S) protein [Gammaproteobacteria bacterium]
MQVLCTLGDLDAAQARGVTIERDGLPLELFVVRREDEIFAYVDRCPHAGLPLAWVADQYLDASGEFLVCATHGARFDIASGECRGGPCGGRGLTPLPVRVEGDRVVLDE